MAYAVTSGLNKLLKFIKIKYKNWLLMNTVKLIAYLQNTSNFSSVLILQLVLNCLNRDEPVLEV